MVDALLNAAESEGDEMNSHDSLIPLRFCEFCNSSSTPTWRRGPAGKGSLCNACGIKWRLRKRIKNEKRNVVLFSASPSHVMMRSKPPKARVNFKRERNSFLSEESSPKRKRYYCKYCNQTWALSHFRNSQQFGAHCSNCSRRPKDGEEKDEDMENEGIYEYSYSPEGSGESPNSPQSPESPSHQDGLLLRLVHVVEHQLVDVHELAGIRDELSSLKTELLSREEARQAELQVLQSRLYQELADLQSCLKKVVSSHGERTVRRIVELEQGLRGRASVSNMYVN